MLPADDRVWGGYSLEYFVDEGGSLNHLPITRLPFLIGRRPGAQLPLSYSNVSKDHAEIYGDRNGLRVRDLGSTNGTHVNHDRVRDAALATGDVLHFGSCEFRLTRGSAPERRMYDPPTVRLEGVRLPDRFGADADKLRALLRDRRVTAIFQPIVELRGGAVFAHEALGRGGSPELPSGPEELLALASMLRMAGELSELFRRRACELSASRADIRHLFLNLHPSEIDSPALLDSVGQLRSLVPEGMAVTLELHERAVTEPAYVAGLRARLAAAGVGLAYDDFGAGQARLLELGDAPPDVLKFSMRLIHGVDRAPASRHRVLTSLVTLARDLGARTVAEGVETPAEAAACAELGFDLAQGHHFGGRLAGS